jgi:ATP-binding cassette subfamily C protein CydCD
MVDRRLLRHAHAARVLIGASDEQLRVALGAARLGAWVDGLPAGLDTYVGELGDRMSGGERQRLAGLYAADEVIVLDGGRVVQRGTHDELAVRPGAYADIWRREQGLR